MRTPEEFADWFNDKSDAGITNNDVNILTAAVQARDEEWAERERVAFSAEYERAELAAAQLRIAREALERIAEYDTDFAIGVDENVNRLQACADKALAALSQRGRK